MHCRLKRVRLIDRDDFLPTRLSYRRPVGTVKLRVEVLLCDELVDLIEDVFALLVVELVSCLWQLFFFHLR